VCYDNKSLMSFFHFRPKFPHHSGQLSCHTDACTYNQWPRLGHGRQLHTPSITNTHLLISSPLMVNSSLYSLSLRFTLIYLYPYRIRSRGLHIIDGYGMMAIIIPTTHFFDATHLDPDPHHDPHATP